MGGIQFEVLSVETVDDLFGQQIGLAWIGFDYHTVDIGHLPELNLHSHVLVGQLLYCDSAASDLRFG